MTLRANAVTAALSLSVALGASGAQSQSLPDGAQKDMVEGVCTGCHQVNQITRSSGYTAEGWRELTATMIDLSGDPEAQSAILHAFSDTAAYRKSELERLTQIVNENCE
jgi:hypothetical protein